MKIKKPRIELTDHDLERFFNAERMASIPELVKRTGLPYMLIYNIVNKRVSSLSERHYRILFEAAPPAREPKKIDGSLFRRMVDLWLFLNDDATKSDLYRAFYGTEHTEKIDHRIFTGHINTVSPKLEQFMRKKFSDAGLDQQTVEQWMDELEMMDHKDRIPYVRIRPVLVFLQKELDVHPTHLLNQSSGRYESGMLKTVPRSIYDDAVRLQKKVEKALNAGQRLEIEKIRDRIYGGKQDYMLYAEVESELHFLRKFGKKSAKSYLGRGTSAYENKRAKRIASWRGTRIFKDCDELISQRPELSLSVLPQSRQKRFIQRLLGVLVPRIARLLAEREGSLFEKQILAPSRAQTEYRSETHGFTRFDMVSSALGMTKKAFDLMVAKNCEIFRKVGRFDRRWYLSDLYLKELSENAYFDLISVNYEIMAKEVYLSGKSNTCMY